MHLKSVPQKLNFVMAKAISKTYLLNCSYKCPCMFPHSYTPYMKLTIFLLGKTIENKAKRMLDSERTFKIEVRSVWTVLEILLASAVMCI